MRCARCGASLTEEDERCPRCHALGAAVVAAPPLEPGVDGIPVVTYNPTLAGAPVAPEPYLVATPFPAGYATHQTSGVRVAAPQPAPRRRTFWLWSSLILVIFVLAGLAAGLLILMVAGVVALPPLLNGANQGQSSASPTASPQFDCNVASADPAAAQALLSAQLTTGVRDEQTQDFRPIDDVSSFHAGSRAFITFAVGTQGGGTAGVTFCTPVGTFPGTLTIPPGSRGRYAQFSLDLPQQALGGSVATLTWNGAVAASLSFTITA